MSFFSLLIIFYIFLLPYVKNIFQKKKFLKKKDMLADEKFKNLYQKYGKKDRKKLVLKVVAIIYFSIYILDKAIYMFISSIENNPGIIESNPWIYDFISIYVYFKMYTSAILVFGSFFISFFGLIIIASYKNMKKLTSVISKGINKKEYNKKFNEFVKSIDTNLSYSIDVNDKDSSDCNREFFSLYNVNNNSSRYLELEDYISGFIDANQYLNMYELCCDNVDSNSSIFSFVSVDKSLSSEIRILCNNVISDTLSNNKYKVELDNELFNKNFIVYSVNKNLVYSIITHDIIDKLNIFRKKFVFDFDIILKNNKIYFRFYTGKMFEKNMDIESLYLYYSVVSFILDITKFFSKEINNINF